MMTTEEHQASVRAHCKGLAARDDLLPEEKYELNTYRSELITRREEFLRVATPILAAAVAKSMFPSPGRDDAVATAASWATHLIELADKKFSL